MPSGFSPKINALVQSGTYRDIPRSVTDAYLSGQKTEDETIAAITGTPVFNPNIGPQIDYGQGSRAMTAQDYTNIQAPYKSLANIPITSSVITSKPQTLYQSPIPTPDYPISQLGVGEIAPPVLSAPESELSKSIKDIRAKQLEVAGRPAYQAQQEDIQGIQAKQQLINDLSNQLNLIKVEGQAIPLQAAGVNVTSGMLGAQQAELSRQNAVKALTVYAQLQGAQGNLATAQSAADRATNLKYAPLEAEIKAKLANIDLMSKDPELTAAEKTRLQTQKDIQDAKTEKVAQAKQDAKDIWDDVYLKAVENGLTDPIILKKIMDLRETTLTNPNAKFEAIQLAAPFLKKAVEYSEPYLLGGDYVQKNLKTGEIRTAVNVAGGTGGVEKPLGILDIQRYNKDYPNAGVTAGDTESEANSKVQKSTQILTFEEFVKEAGQELKMSLTPEFIENVLKPAYEEEKNARSQNTQETSDISNPFK